MAGRKPRRGAGRASTHYTAAVQGAVGGTAYNAAIRPPGAV